MKSGRLVATVRPWLVLVLAFSSLTGCAVSRQNVRQAEHIIRVTTEYDIRCHTLGHCARKSELRQLGDQAMAQSEPGAPFNYAVLLGQGQDALIARLNLIRAARNSIDVQTYLWVADDAGNLVLDELMRAARRGVEVRVIVDQLGAFGGVKRLARIARSHINFHLRLYNPTLNDSQTQYFEYVTSAVCCFFKLNQRMHNKLMLIDDTVGITGGRNYQNRYFDWDQAFDFRDRDILVAGPVGAQMAASFDVFWQHPRTMELTHLRDVNQRLRIAGSDAPGWAPPAWDNSPRVEFALAAALDPRYIHEHFIEPVFKLGTVSYFSDLPGKTTGPQRTGEQKLTAQLMQMVAGTREELVLQTPYLIISEPAQDIFRRLHRERPKVDILVSTNSLASTDAFVVYALSYKYKRRYLVDFGFTIYEFKPHPADAAELIANFAQLSGRGGNRGSGESFDPVPVSTPGVRISMHAKSMVVDRELVMIGSHNFDPRSHEYNTESGIIVHDRRLAAAVRAAILNATEPGNSWLIGPRKTDNFLAHANLFIAKLSAKLPIFDFWPIRYATSYALEPWCEPVLPSDPSFFACYRPVGDFPEVDLPLKSIYTRIITAFGAGISGVL